MEASARLAAACFASADAKKAKKAAECTERPCRAPAADLSFGLGAKCAGQLDGPKAMVIRDQKGQCDPIRNFSLRSTNKKLGLNSNV